MNRESRAKLLEKAGRLGLHLPTDLEKLAIARGCRYYDSRNEGEHLRREAWFRIETPEFSNAELAIALLSPRFPPSLYRQRLGSAMLSAPDVDPRVLAEMAVVEECAGLVRYIAKCGREVEADNEFWDVLLARLPKVSPPKKTPHITRLMEMTGITRGRVGIQKRWIRPSPVAET